MKRSLTQMCQALLACVAFSPLAFAAPLSASATAAEQNIERAQTLIQERPDHLPNQAELVYALILRASETGDTRFLGRAHGVVAAALQRDPASRDMRRARAQLLLAEKRYTEARDDAVWVNKTIPDDLQTYATLTEIYLALGRYDDAEAAAQWLLNLRPNERLGYLNAARVREAYGDHIGALEFAEKAFPRIPDTETSTRASVLARLAALYRLEKRISDADVTVARALTLVPSHPAALAEEAEVREAQGRHADSAALWQTLFERTARPGFLFRQAEALLRAGQPVAAAAVWQRFEPLARAVSDAPDNATIELVLYYADHASRPADALRLAKSAAAKQQDAATLDALAWAQFRHGDIKAAAETITRVLDINAKVPRWQYHAGEILLATGEIERARELLEAVVYAAPASLIAQHARTTLAQMRQPTQPEMPAQLVTPTKLDQARP